MQSNKLAFTKSKGAAQTFFEHIFKTSITITYCNFLNTLKLLNRLFAFIRKLKAKITA